MDWLIGRAHGNASGRGPRTADAPVTPRSSPPAAAAAPAGEGAVPGHQGHRRRLRARFLGDLGASMPDYELLELLLTLALPRADVKPLAKALDRRFGGFAGVIAASPEALRQVPGVGETALAALKLAQASGLRLLRQQVLDRPLLSSWRQVVDYCRAAMSREPVEQFRLLFLDSGNRLIAEEVQQRGTVNHTPVYPREVVKRALELGAVALVMAHNHPGGDPAPSRADIAMTRAVEAACAQLDIRLHDHIVIGAAAVVSFRASGHLEGPPAGASG